MKTATVLCTAVLAVLGFTLSTPAMAHGGGVRFGFVIGAPIFYPYPPIYYVPPPQVIFVPAQAPVRVEQAPPLAPPPPPPDWLFCRKTNAYYPYVRECPDGWEHVPAQPPK